MQWPSTILTATEGAKLGPRAKQWGLGSGEARAGNALDPVSPSAKRGPQMGLVVGRVEFSKERGGTTLVAMPSLDREDGYLVERELNTRAS